MLRPTTQRRTRFSNAYEFHVSAHSNRQFVLVFLVYFSLFLQILCWWNESCAWVCLCVPARVAYGNGFLLRVCFFLHLASTEHNSFSTELCLNIFSNALMSWQIELRIQKNTHIGNATEHRMKTASFRPRTFRSDIWFMVASNFR